LLLPSDQAALRGSRFLPAGSNAVASGLSIRSATLDTLTYSIVPPQSVNLPVLGYTFPSGVVQPGNQVRWKIYGTYTNTNASGRHFQQYAGIVQGSTTYPITDDVLLPGSTTGVIVLEGAFTFSQPGAAGRGVVSNQKAQSYVGSSGGSMVVSGYVSAMVTNGAYSTPPRISGDPLITVSGSQSQIAANQDPNSTLVSPSGAPIGVSIELGTDSFVTFTIQGGWLEVM